MSLLVESIRIEFKQLQHVEYHNARFNNARKIMFGKNEAIDLQKIIAIPENISDNRYKCRITTNGTTINYDVTEYHQRNIQTLKVVCVDSIDYSIKTDNRDQLNSLYDQKENCDDIIIVTNGFITDSWAANIILFNGNKWVTPNTPLLNGTMRQYLLNQKKIKEEAVAIDDLNKFKKIKLVNAMIDFDRAPEISVPSGISY